jgi:hypothetical protein
MADALIDAAQRDAAKAAQPRARSRARPGGGTAADGARRRRA